MKNKYYYQIYFIQVQLLFFQSNSVLDTDVKDVKETKVIENKKQIAQSEDAIKPIKPDQIHQLSNAKNSLKKEVNT